MQKFDWDSSKYTIGIAAMDEEHKLLFGLISSLKQKNDQQNEELIDRILATLDLYVKNHFRHEERILERIQYPQIKEHLKQHKQFEKSLKNIKDIYAKNGYSAKLMAEVTEFLSIWITDHIQREDKAYVSYLVK